MKYVETKLEGPHTFNRTDLTPMIAFGIEIASKYLLTKDFIVGILTGYALLYGDLGVQLFLKENSSWIDQSLTIAAKALYDG